MKVVIDTNVLASAALKDRIPEEVILFIVAHGDMQWIVSPEILAEYKAARGAVGSGSPGLISKVLARENEASTVSPPTLALAPLSSACPACLSQSALTGAALPS